MSGYRAKFSIGEFSGYCLWCASVKPDGRNRYAGGPFFCGRTDTRLQACGFVGMVLEGLPIEAIREDGGQSWPKIRAMISLPSDSKRHTEGLSWWKSWEGDKAELETEGGAFLDRLRAGHETATQAGPTGGR